LRTSKIQANRISKNGGGNMERELAAGGVNVEVVQGDVTAQEVVEAIVNAANARLESGGGVAGAIHAAAGPGLAEEARPLAPIGPGEAVVTSGHNLPNRYVIHALGPVYGQDHPEAELLANCYRNSLAIAEERGISSVAFPALSTGVFGYPKREAAEVALGTVIAEAESLRSVRLVRFVLFGEEDRQVYEDTLARLLGEGE
jgi:O-acetyl-ADP-ribose deacetylase (regulator of RNase III)